MRDLGKTLMNYEYKSTYWFSEWDKRPYYSCVLKLNGKVVMCIPNANKDIGEKNMIGMYLARNRGKYDEIH